MPLSDPKDLTILVERRYEGGAARQQLQQETLVDKPSMVGKQSHCQHKLCRSPRVEVCRIALKLLCPAEVGTTEQPRRNRDSKPVVLWLPSGQSAQQEADHELWEVGDRHISDPLA
jgi:hypothetical protein